LDAILATQGVTSGIIATLVALKNRGVTKCGIVEPFYTYHQKQVKTVLGPDSLEIIPSNDDFSLNWEHLATAFRTIGGLIVTNPGNPTGLVLNSDTVERLVALAAEHNVHLIFDECYCDMTYVAAPFYSPIAGGLRKHVTVCRGFSKCLGIQSWRIGYVVSEPSVIAELMNSHDPVYICVPMLQHAFGDYLSDHHDDFVQHSQSTAALIRRNWQVLSPVFERTMGWTPRDPEGSMYGVFWHNGDDDLEQVKAALAKGVGVCPGTMFTREGTTNSRFVRIHCGISAAKADDIARKLAQHSA